MSKKIIRLTESDIHQIVKETIKNILKESYNDDDAYMSNYNDAMSDYYDDIEQGELVPSFLGGKSYDQYAKERMNDMQIDRDTRKYWTNRDNERGRQLMKKWIDGKRSTDDLEDADFSLGTSFWGLQHNKK